LIPNILVNAAFSASYVLDRIWESPHNAIALLKKVALSNHRIFDLEQQSATPTAIAGQVKAAAVVLSDVASPTR